MTSLDEAAPGASVDDVGEPLALHDLFWQGPTGVCVCGLWQKLDWQDFLGRFVSQGSSHNQLPGRR